jgi:hypothetical protein
MNDTSVDPTKCPLCGQDNQCSVAGGAASGSCWCMTASIPEGLLATIPPERRMKACICKDCLQAYRSRFQAECVEADTE